MRKKPFSPQPVAPAVLADPAALRIVVADNLDAVPTGRGARDMAIDPAAIAEEILIDDETACDRPARGEPVLDRHAPVSLVLDPIRAMVDCQFPGTAHACWLPVQG